MAFLLCVQVVYVYGPQTHIFCAVEGVNGNLRFLPETWTGVAQWFGVTAFLFCVHSMVSLCLCSPQGEGSGQISSEGSGNHIIGFKR